MQPTRTPAAITQPLSLPGGTRLAATASLPLSSPFSSSPFPGVGQPCRIAPRRAMGRLRQPGGPHAEDRRVRAGLGSTVGKVKDSSAPSPSIRGAPERRPRAPPALPGERPRVWGAFPLRATRGPDSKGPVRCGTDAKLPTPSWGFLFHHRPICTGLEEGAGAPPPRRAGQGRSREQNQNRNTYAARDAAARGKERRSFTSEEGAGPEQGTVRRRERLLRHAIAVLDPASTTPPPRREHHRSHLIPFLPP
jgi:hypothetical protein